MIQTISEKVKDLLIRYPKLRDDDFSLKCNFWNEEVKKKTGKNLNELTAFEYLDMFNRKKLTNGDTISRARRKMQEMFPELRGARYAERKGQRQTEVMHELNDIKEKTVLFS